MRDPKPALRRVGAAAIGAMMSDVEVAADPLKAFRIAQAAMRATLTAAVERPPG